VTVVIVGSDGEGSGELEVGSGSFRLTYLSKKVDASLDAQHAARAGRLMQRRAAAEKVQYIAISRKI
jgi:hypothetical protein